MPRSDRGNERDPTAADAVRESLLRIRAARQRGTGAPPDVPAGEPSASGEDAFRDALHAIVENRQRYEQRRARGLMPDDPLDDWHRDNARKPGVTDQGASERPLRPARRRRDSG